MISIDWNWVDQNPKGPGISNFPCASCLPQKFSDALCALLCDIRTSRALHPSFTHFDTTFYPLIVSFDSFLYRHPLKHGRLNFFISSSTDIVWGRKTQQATPTSLQSPGASFQRFSFPLSFLPPGLALNNYTSRLPVGSSPPPLRQISIPTTNSQRNYPHNDAPNSQHALPLDPAHDLPQPSPLPAQLKHNTHTTSTHHEWP